MLKIRQILESFNKKFPQKQMVTKKEVAIKNENGFEGVGKTYDSPFYKDLKKELKNNTHLDTASFAQEYVSKLPLRK